MSIYGKSAHAGVNPEDGISAIQVAAKAIAAMTLGRIDDETTANIGKFQGGSALNVVCDFVQLEAEARSIVQEKVELQVAQMRDALETTCRKYGATAEFEVRSFTLHLASMMNTKLYNLHSVPSAVLAGDKYVCFRWWQ